MSVRVPINENAKAKARDFINSEKQFHLGFLSTERFNPVQLVPREIR